MSTETLMTSLSTEEFIQQLIEGLSPQLRKIFEEEISKSVRTKVLFEMRMHAVEKLWPYPDRMMHLRDTDTDFWTEVAIFEINIQLVLQELEDNIIQFSKDDAQRYVDNVIKTLHSTRRQVNQFFGTNEYNSQLQQIEAEGVSEEPELGLTPADSISEDKLEFPVHVLALYLNKICLWGEFIMKKLVSRNLK